MSSTETEADEGPTTEVDSIWGEGNLWFIATFTALSLVGVLISTGVLNLGIANVTSKDFTSDTVAVPAFVYLYASLGALGYIFTKLMTKFERYDEETELKHLVEMGMRIPAAWVLGAGTYLLSTALLPPSAPGTLQFTAGFAFLVGLYVNVAMKSLGSLADRLLGRDPPAPSADEDEDANGTRQSRDAEPGPDDENVR